MSVNCLPGTIGASVVVGLLLATAVGTAAPATSPTAAEGAVEIARPARLTVASAKPSNDRRSGAPFVLITLSRDSSRALRALTDTNRGRLLELRLDGTFLLEPRIVESFSGRAFQISGNFSVAEAGELARKMTSGGVLTARIRD